MDDATDISEVSYDTFTNASATPWGAARSILHESFQNERLPDDHRVGHGKADLHVGRQQHPVFQTLITKRPPTDALNSCAAARSLRDRGIVFSALSRRFPVVHSQRFSDAKVYQTLPISPTLLHPEERRRSTSRMRRMRGRSILVRGKELIEGRLPGRLALLHHESRSDQMQVAAGRSHNGRAETLRLRGFTLRRRPRTHAARSRTAGPQSTPPSDRDAPRQQ